MIFKNSDAKPVQALPGLTRRTLAQGQSLMLCEFSFDANVTVPVHTHPHEQVGYIVHGHVEMTFAGEKYDLHQGDSYYAPSNVPHGAFIHEPSIIVDTFCPPREDYR